MTSAVIKYGIGLLSFLASSVAYGAGTLPIVLTQQFSFTNCVTNTNACGTPLAGGLLYFYQAGTNNVVQNSFQDTSLTLTNPWPLVLDANGRVPPFYLADGSIHVRLTDANNVAQFDFLNMLVIGASGGGGPGSGVDPTTVLSTGDIKFRPTSEFVTGWVKLNGQTVGNAGSGASQRASSDVSSLFSYLWANCPDSHCPVVGGRGSTGSADFAANKQITLPDWRGRIPVGLDDMGNSAAGRLLSSNVTSGGGDTITTPGATGGEANHTITQAQIPSYTLPSSAVASSNGNTIINDPSHTHSFTYNSALEGANPAPLVTNIQQSGGGTTVTTQNSFTGITATTTVSTSVTPTVTSGGSGQAHNVMNPFMLGTWYMKL